MNTRFKYELCYRCESCSDMFVRTHIYDNKLNKVEILGIFNNEILNKAIHKCIDSSLVERYTTCKLYAVDLIKDA